ncbi:fibrinogen-like protein 1-like protein isoform X1 [Megalops cyprinoides]|uniref:fibrinogen-like protein 1-like protein isoform X1 n=2 Tax=Megalops cyprinoides TaxID=118141 RepID=UPI001863B5BE|nr:fibrinogen-like protein 1-like protein isoform X1 [Megalops cyprinoides]
MRVPLQSSAHSISNSLQGKQDRSMQCNRKSLRGWMGALMASVLCVMGAQAELAPAVNVHVLPLEEHKLVLNLGLEEFPSDCYEIWQSSGGQARDGVYLIQPKGSLIMAYCAMQDGGWTVVQHITVNSSVDFDRTWEEYKLGFGSLTGDHWLGNEYLHQLTSRSGHYKLGVKLVDKDAITKIGEYDPVLLESEEAQYRLRLGLFRGTAVDALTQDTENYLHDNQKFTTKDRDNDNYFQNCAKLEFQGVPGGGWWYDACAGANLNRRNVIYWQKDCNKEHLCKYAWMMVKPSDLVKVIHTGGCQKDEL